MPQICVSITIADTMNTFCEHKPIPQFFLMVLVLWNSLYTIRLQRKVTAIFPVHSKEEYGSTRQGVSERLRPIHPRSNSHPHPLKNSLGRLHSLSGHFLGSLLIIELRSFVRSARSVFIVMTELPRLHTDL